MRRDKRRGTIGFDLAEDTHLLARSMYGPPAFIAPPSVEVSASEPSRHIPTDSMDTSNKPNQAQQQGKGRMRILFPNENTTGVRRRRLLPKGSLGNIVSSILIAFKLLFSRSTSFVAIAHVL